MSILLRSVLALAALVGSATAAESDALAISAKIQARHLPFGTVIDPFLDNDDVTGYTRCGDSAVWTGHYLAAESYHYKVTHDRQALSNVQGALFGIQNLVDVTGSDILARCYVPKDSPFAAGILHEESHNGSYEGSCLNQDCFWIGNTSRDQYVGVFFGLAAAYRLLDDQPAVRVAARALVTRLLKKLEEGNWSVQMPDGRYSTTFLARSDQRLSLLAFGAEVNDAEFGGSYRSSRFWESAFVGTPLLGEVLDPHNSYFKFNLDVEVYHQLATYETSRLYRDRYRSAYGLLRRTIDDHGNAHFNMIDRAINGPDERRDAATRDLLEEWLKRPRRDVYVDLRGKYSACFEEDRACNPIPVAERVNTDFLWQRSPFLLYGGGVGNIESAGIDYILPYWMARFYGVL